VRWENKIPFISYFLRKICAKNYQKRFIYVSVTARQTSDIFWDTVYAVSDKIYIEMYNESLKILTNDTKL